MERRPSAKGIPSSRQSESDGYEPLLPPSGNTEHAPATAVVVSSSSNIAPGTVVAAGIPVDPMEATQGQLVFLPDLPNAVQMWHGQRFIMMAWLVSSLVSLVLFAPLFMASGLFLAAEIAAVLGIIASVVQLCERGLAASNTLELGSQMKLVASCGTVACFLDVITVLLDLLLLWKMGCDPDDDICAAIAKFALVFALSCANHAFISWVASTRAQSLMPLLNPVTSGAVQL